VTIYRVYRLSDDESLSERGEKKNGGAVKDVSVGNGTATEHTGKKNDLLQVLNNPGEGYNAINGWGQRIGGTNNGLEGE